MPVLLYRDIKPEHLHPLLARYGLEIAIVNTQQPIPGSFFQDAEDALDWLMIISNQFFC